MTRGLWDRTQDHFRRKRAQLFRDLLQPGPGDRILDLGGGYGDYFATIVPFRHNVWIADVDTRILARAQAKGFQTLLVPTDGHIPAADGAFDIVHCNSVIEHVPPAHRACMAGEIRRVGASWFLQTPNRYFPLELHTRLPLAQFLPHRLLQYWLRVMPYLFDYKDILDWKLLTATELRALFPDGVLVRERFCGLSKSLVIAGGERIGTSRLSAAWHPLGTP